MEWFHTTTATDWKRHRHGVSDWLFRKIRRLRAMSENSLSILGIACLRVININDIIRYNYDSMNCLMIMNNDDILKQYNFELYKHQSLDKLHRYTGTLII